MVCESWATPCLPLFQLFMIEALISVSVVMNIGLSPYSTPRQGQSCLPGSDRLPPLFILTSYRLQRLNSRWVSPRSQGLPSSLQPTDTYKVETLLQAWWIKNTEDSNTFPSWLLRWRFHTGRSKIRRREAAIPAQHHGCKAGMSLSKKCTVASSPSWELSFLPREKDRL